MGCQKNNSQWGVLVIAHMIDCERGEAVKACEAWDDRAGERGVEVERQLLKLCALAEKLDQGV